jgi:hypothetical protein
MNMLRVTGDGGWRFKLIEADHDTHSSSQSGQWSKHSLNVSPEDITDKGTFSRTIFRWVMGYHSALCVECDIEICLVF